MKPSPELFQLVHSLTKSEKRYFKLNSSLQAGDKNYLMLFEAIDLQNVYNEEQIKRQFKNELFIKHLPSEKNHLYQLILKSLRSFHADKSAASQLQELLKNIEILNRKTLYKECSKVIKRAKKLAYENEKFYYLLDIISWEKALIEDKFQPEKFDKMYSKLTKEESECLAKLRNFAEYQMLFAHIGYVYRREGLVRTLEDKKIIDEIVNHPLVKGKNTAISTKAASTCYFIKGLCALAQRNYEESIINLRKVINLFDRNPNIKQELPKRYIKAINYLLYSYMNANQYDDFYHNLDKLKELENNPHFSSADIKLKLYYIINTFELIALEASNKFAAGEKSVNEIEKFIDTNRNKMPKEDEISLYYTIAVFYFSSKEYKKSLHWNNLILNDNDALLRQDLYIFSRLLNLLIHYELENYDLLEYVIKSTLRFMKKKQRNYKFESVTIKYLAKLAKMRGNNCKPIFKEMKTALEELFKDYFERVGLEYFDFISWIDSKILNKDYAEIKADKKAVKQEVDS